MQRAIHSRFFAVVYGTAKQRDNFRCIICYLRTVEEWQSDFWNNNEEFPNDGSGKSNLRVFAYKTAKKWFKTIQL